MLLEVRDVSARYGGVMAVRTFSLSVEEGEVVSLIGPNGAGKSTVLRMLSGLTRPSGGDISFGGARINGLRADKIAHLGISLVPEGRGLFPRMSVLENLQLGAYGRKKTDVAATAELVFERFARLRERSRQPAGSLSGGEQQMLAIGRALMARPRMLLIDEPSLGLAPQVIDQLGHLIPEIANAWNATVLLVEQNAHLALQASERCYVMETGRIAFSGRSEEIASDTRLRSAYLGG
jgi:branched-chain amino acid transport system ATP-binding protein